MSSIVFLSAWTVATTVSFAADIEITEVAWMGTAESQFGEWIELHNSSGASVSLDGWKLYESGGDALVFSLSKTISAGGYLVVERTTPSMSDPLPGISDEAGSFGGSGLSNTGEHLVLKDKSGTIVANLPFQSGWPAGDTETKQTMQKKESTWITASATPKTATNGSVQDDESLEETEDTTGTVITDESEKQVVWEPAITFSSPKQAFVGVPIKIAATVTQKTGMTAVGNFFWNTGAGQVIEQKFLEPITITYQHPGEYVVTLAYSRHANAIEPELVSQFSITVANPLFALEHGDAATVFVKNISSSSLDLYQWQLMYAGNRYIFPRYSIVKPGNRLAVPATVFGKALFATLPTLINPSGTPVIAAPVSGSNSGTVVQATRAVTTPKHETLATESALESPFLAAAAGVDAGPKSNQRTWIAIALGALIAISVFLYLLLERFKAREE